MAPFNSIGNIKNWVKAEQKWACVTPLKLFRVTSPNTAPTNSLLSCKQLAELRDCSHAHTNPQRPSSTPLSKEGGQWEEEVDFNLLTSSAHPTWQPRMEQRDACIPKNSAAGWKVLLQQCHGNFCGKMASHLLI